MRLARLTIYLVLLLVATSCGGKSSDEGGAGPLPADGRIVFVVDHTGADADMDLYTVQADGSGLRRLTKDSYLNRSPFWSPDGARIAFVSNRTGYFSNVFVMKADGSGESNLTKDNETDHRVLGWAADGRLLIDQGTGSTYRLKLIDAAGDRPARTLVETGDLSLNEAVSPDGSRVAFDDIRSVQVIQIDDKLTRTRLTTSSQRINNEEPAWSPDGKRIAFISNRDGVSEVFVMNADGSGQTRLTSGTHEATTPRWSPDGKHIAFLRDTRDPDAFRSRTHLWLINADGTAETRVTRQDCDGQYGFTWSPDSSRLAFVRGCNVQTSQETTQLFVVNADGTAEKRIATEINRSISSPAWSPAPAR